MLAGWNEAREIKQPSECFSIDYVLKKFDSLFASHSYDLGTFKMTKHHIDTRNETPYFSGISRIPLAYEHKLNIMIDDMLRNNIIERSNSPWNSPIVIVPKDDHEIRLCIDYRKLNSLTCRPIHPFPSAQEIFDQLGGNAYFTTLDMTKGYYQIEMSEFDKEKTAFSTSNGHYHFLRMPFGLCGAPATFQRALSTVLSGEIGTSCAVYLDDIIVYGRTVKDHNVNLCKVLDKLSKAGFKLSRNKCHFLQSEVRFLGHLINKEGIHTDPKKVETIKNWVLPSKINELHSFICFANYYRKFIRNFNQIVYPLESLIKRRGSKPLKCEIDWNDEAKDSFEKIKHLLCHAPVLSFPTPNDTFVLDTDASDSGMGAVLSQRGHDNKERVILFASNKLSPTERNYCTTRRELLAVVSYLKMFRHYLVGKKFILRTDHQSLIGLLNWKKPSSKQYFAWIEQIMEFDFCVEHRKGKNHINADILSRLPSCSQCFQHHKKAKTFKRKTHVRIVNEEKKTSRQKKNIKEINVLEGAEITKKYHSFLGHAGGSKIFNILRHVYVWPEMKQTIFKITKNCKICLQRKCGNNMNIPKHHIGAGYPLQTISVDIAGPLPLTKKGNMYILGLIDNFSRFPVLTPLKSLNSSEITKALEKYWFFLLGAPAYVHSDRGTYFISAEFDRLLKKWNVKHSMSSPYYPKGNSIVERLFKSVKDMIYCFAKEKNMEWDECLHQVEFALRCCTNSSTKLSPYEALFGFQVKMSAEIKNNRNEITQKMLKLAMKAAREKSKVRGQLNHKIGDLVYAKILPQNQKSVYKPRFDGPYEIVNIRGSCSYDLKHIQTGKYITRNIHHLKFVDKDHDSKLKYIVNSQSSSNISKENESNPDQSRHQESSSRPIRNRTKPVRFGFS